MTFTLICFHVWMNVAQLKLSGQWVKRRMIIWFPRLNERGSIEAISQKTRRTRISWFPRLNERGSIEAGRKFLTLQYRSKSFHVWMNVAQLKRVGHQRVGEFAGGFHVWMNVAQLKLITLAPQRTLENRFHVWMNVAQLKRKRRCRWSRRAVVSISISAD